jgi:hypothetical protein
MAAARRSQDSLVGRQQVLQCITLLHLLLLLLLLLQVETCATITITMTNYVLSPLPAGMPHH